MWTSRLGRQHGMLPCLASDPIVARHIPREDVAAAGAMVIGCEDSNSEGHAQNLCLAGGAMLLGEVATSKRLRCRGRPLLAGQRCLIVNRAE